MAKSILQYIKIKDRAGQNLDKKLSERLNVYNQINHDRVNPFLKEAIDSLKIEEIFWPRLIYNNALFVSFYFHFIAVV